MSLRIMWALAFGILLVAGQTYGERPFRETARIPLRGGWQAPSELVGDDDVATTQIWISQDGNVNAGSSWSTGEDPSLWGATDIVLVDGVASQVSMTSGLDQNGVSFARMDVTDNFTGDLGLPGTPLHFSNIGIAVMRGPGTLYLQTTAGTTPIFVDSLNHLNAVSIPAGNVWTIHVEQGHVDVGASATFVQGVGVVATMGPYATIKVAGSANTAPHFIHCWDGNIDLGLRGPTLANGTINVGGGVLRLHKLTGANSYKYLTQTGGRIDFDMLEANGDTMIARFVAGTADFRKCQYVFSTLTVQSYIGPGMQIIPGPATTESILKASGILDFRKTYP